MLTAAIVVGNWVTQRIEQGVVQNSGSAAALYIESFLSPLGTEISEGDSLSEPVRAALDEVFFGPTLGARVVSYKIWREGGRIVDASDEQLIGQTFDPSDDLRAAWTGVVAASFADLTDTEDSGEAELGIPLLEVYSPIREIWTGEIVAVAEFYQRADELAVELADARQQSWMIIVAIFASCGLLLLGIVQAGSRLISRQKAALEIQLGESKRMAELNESLKNRVMAAAQRSIAQSDRVMQRIGQDLHDGAAQHLSLASLRFESSKPADEPNAETVRQALENAMTELRAISRGLALPDIDRLSLGATISRAVEDHQNAYGNTVDATILIPDQVASGYEIKLCAYRFVQEALSNVTRHAQATDIQASAYVTGARIEIEVKDDGIGFDTSQESEVRLDGGQGLLGMRDRVQALNGELQIKSTLGVGSVLRLILPLKETGS